MEKLKMESVDMTQKNIERVGALFPNVITEMQDENGNIKKGINFELLKQELSNNVVDGEECYDFTWVGKKASILEGNAPIRKTLRPSKDESKDWENTGNLYIEGDNLDVLKLLQESYLNSIKMIYIDPPYNTGNDFIYKDNFTMDKSKYDEQIGLLDEEENRLFQNNESNGRFHSDWCSMLYPRLKLAHNLLTDDGVIFISIDDNEIRNLRNICDETFGEINFIAQIAVQLNPRGRNLDKYIAKTHESIVVYAKNYDNRNTMFGVPKEGKMVDEYNKEDDHGEYRSTGLRNRNQSFNPTTRPNLYYPLYVNPSNQTISLEKNESYTDEVWPDAPGGIKTCWTWAKPKVKSKNHLLLAERTGDEWRIYRKDYMLDESGVMATTLIKSLWTDKEINNDYGKKSIKDLFGSSVMDFPKSPDLIKKLIIPSVKDKGIILDFFSGSATTAHAVMQLNVENGGNRKFIMVQLPEVCDEKSEAYKAGYKTICEIGKERIRRAGDKINEEIIKNNAQLKIGEDSKLPVDTGFRVLKVDSTNMKDVYYAANDYSQLMLAGLESNIKEDRTDLDLLYGVLLDWGLPLSLSHKIEEIDGVSVHTVDEGSLVVCFADKVSESLVREIAKRQPLRVVFRDSSFANSPDKINVKEIFKLHAPNTTVKVI